MMDGIIVNNYSCGCSVTHNTDANSLSFGKEEWVYCREGENMEEISERDSCQCKERRGSGEERGFDNITLLICENDRHSFGRVWLQNVVNSVGDVTTLSQEDLQYYRAAIYVLSQPYDHTGRVWEIKGETE